MFDLLGPDGSQCVRDAFIGGIFYPIGGIYLFIPSCLLELDDCLFLSINILTMIRLSSNSVICLHWFIPYVHTLPSPTYLPTYL